MWKTQYDLLNVIGQGKVGIVYKAFDKLRCFNVAIKIIDISQCECLGLPLDEIMFETEAVESLSKNGGHPSILKYYDNFVSTFKERDSMFIVTEYINGKDLFDFIYPRIDSRDYLLKEMVLKIIHETLTGLNYIHSKGYVHRDIKAENIMVELDDKGSYKSIRIVDFGFVCSKRDTVQFSPRGTKIYISPEYSCKNLNYESCIKHDIWALGVTLFLITNFRYPFREDRYGNPYFATLIGSKYRFSDDVNKLIDMMLEMDPNKRILTDDLLKLDIWN